MADVMNRELMDKGLTGPQRDIMNLLISKDEHIRALEIRLERLRKKGHWVFGESMGHAWMKCSECCVSQSGQTACWSYCPNCGAEMSGEVEYGEV